MGSIYRSGGGGSGSIYRSSGGGGVPVGTKAAGGSKKHRGGIIGTLEHVATQTPKDLYHAAVNAPAGVFHLAEAPVLDTVDFIKHPWSHPATTHSGAALIGLGKGTAETLRHPLRNPGTTLLTALPAAEGLARVGEAASAARAGGTAGEVVRTALKGAPAQPRVFQHEGLKVEAPGSRSALGRAGQAAHGKVLARSPGLTARRVGKELSKTRAVVENIERGPATALIAAGRKLKPEQQTALRTVAEGVSTDQRIAFHRNQIEKTASAAVRKRHAAKITVLEKSRQFIDETGPVPKISAGHPQLVKLYEQTRGVAKGRETLLEHIGKMTPAAAQGRISAPGRVIGGARFERAGRVAQERPRTRPEAVQELKRLDSEWSKAVNRVYQSTKGTLDAKETLRRNQQRARFDRQNRGVTRAGTASGAGGRKVEPFRPKTLSQEARDQAERTLRATIKAHPDNSVTKRLAEVDRSREELRAALEASHPVFGEGAPEALGAVSEKVVQPAGLKGAEDFTGGEFRVPYTFKKTPRSLERNAMAPAKPPGQPRVPSSLTQQYKGGLLKSANFRDETTRLVGESNLEAQRLGSLLRLRDQVKQAAKPAPTSRYDIPMRLDKLKAGGLKPDEQALLQKLESGEHLTPVEQDHASSMFETLRSRIFPQPHKLSEEDHAAYTKLFNEGKIGYVDSRLLRGMGKPTPSLESLITRPGARTIDAINNASRIAIFYAKPAYALPNIIGNLALTLIQQGFAAPANLARAARINARLGPELAARIDTLMGEGIAMALSSDRGAGAAAVQKIAGGWSKVIDAPFRRASFLYEADRLGYKTPQQIARLLIDESEQPQLVTVARQANERLIDYASLTPREREFVRRIVFVYPWIKGSTKYAGHFLKEHPVQAGVYGQAGAQAHERAQQELGPLPSYLEGIFKVGGTKEYPQVVNPAAAQIFQTPAQVGSAIGAAVTGHPSRAAEASGFATPAAQFISDIVHQRGIKHALAQRVTTTPQYVFGQRIADSGKGKGQTKLYPPSARSAIEQFLLGGVAPRKLNAATAAKSARLERSGR